MPELSRAEVQRRVSQQGNDIDSLYELTAGIDQKVDTLDAKVDRGFSELKGELAEVRGQLTQVLRLLSGNQ